MFANEVPVCHRPALHQASSDHLSQWDSTLSAQGHVLPLRDLHRSLFGDNSCCYLPAKVPVGLSCSGSSKSALSVHTTKMEAPSGYAQASSSSNDRFLRAQNRGFIGLSKDEEGQWKGPFVFLQLADTQFGFFEGKLLSLSSLSIAGQTF